MSYTHSGKTPIVLSNDPVDADGIDWVFFSYGDWLRTGETITESSAAIVGGEIETDSTYLGTMIDSDGVSYNNCYGVQFSVISGATQVEITHRVTTTVTGIVDLGRTDIDRTAIIKVKRL